MSSPSTPSTAAHHLASLCQQSGRGKSGHPARLWVDAIATTSPPIDQQPEGQRLVLSVILPASSSSPSSSPPSGGEGRAASKPGRSILSRSSCRPSPPCRGASAYWRTPPESGRAAGCHIRAARVVFEKVCFGIFFTVVSL